MKLRLHNLVALSKKGGVVNAVVARSVAEALIKHSGKKELEILDLDGRSVRRTARSSKVQIHKGARKGADLVFLHKIVWGASYSKVNGSQFGPDTNEICHLKSTSTCTEKWKARFYHWKHHTRKQSQEGL